MDFGTLPPEVNSVRMYTGPGSGSMLAAAAAWSRLAAELASARQVYESVISGLTNQGWLGPASEAMAAAAAPYAAWMAATAGLAEQTATQATAAASAFEAARAAVVPPGVIAANRSRLASLVATNTVGQNSAAIAALEAEYGQMWVQDTVAMYGYAGRSAAAAAVRPFAGPPTTTSAAGLGGQAAAGADAGAGAAHSQLSQLINAIPQALNGLGSSPGVPGSSLPLAAAPDPPAPPTPPSLSDVVAPVEALARSVLVANDSNVSVLYGQGQFARNINIELDIAAAGKAAAAAGSGAQALPSAGLTGLRSIAPAVSATVGNAGTVGKLAVPSAWVETAPAVKTALAALPDTGAAAAATAAAAAPGDLFADMAVAGLAGRAIAGTAPRGRPAANTDAQGRLERLAGQLTGTAEVQHWHVDPSRPDNPFTELSKQPGVHTVHLDPGRRTGQTPRQEPGRG